MLKLGGLDNASPKTAQSSDRFKVANNVTFTNQGEITPRPSLEGFNTTLDPLTSFYVRRWDLFFPYAKGTSARKLMQFGTTYEGGFNFKYLWDNGAKVPWGSGVAITKGGTTLEGKNFSDSYANINDVSYILSDPAKSSCSLLRYDGNEVYPTGVGLPWFAPTLSNSFSISGFVLPKTDANGVFVKAVQNTMDMNGDTVVGSTITYNAAKNGVGLINMVAGTDETGRAILVGTSSNSFYYSYDGINWDSNTIFQRSTGIGANLQVSYGVVSGKPTFVAIYPTATGTDSFISNDGKLWRRVVGAIPQSDIWTGMAFGAGLFVAVNNSSATAATRIATSPDGVTWTSRTAPNTNAWNCIAYGSGGFVSLSTTGVGNRSMTSPDGITWTSRTTPSDQSWESVVYSQTTGVWVAVASTGTTTTNLMTTSNPFAAGAWTLRTSPAANQWKRITVGLDSAFNTRYYAICDNNVTTNKYMTSTNPTGAWTGVAAPNAFQGSSIGAIVPSGASYATFAAVGNGASTNKVEYTSLTTWTESDEITVTPVFTGADQTKYTEFQSLAGFSSYYEPFYALDAIFFGRISYDSGSDTFIASEEYFGTLNFDMWTVRQINASVTVGSEVKTFSAIAYKAKSFSPTTFYGDVRIFNTSTLQWETINGNDLAIASGTVLSSRRFITFWTSPLEEGGYVYKGMVPAASQGPAGFMNLLTNINISYPNIENKVQRAESLPFSMSGTLGDWYDQTSYKYSFNELFASSESSRGVDVTTYMGQLLIATSDLIHFSDSTLGGSIEMTEGLASVQIGTSRDGRITAIQGTEDFLVVSRERKVFLVTGTLSTSQYRTQEISNIPIGAYSNSCLVNAGGVVVLLSSVGVWLIDGPNAKKISTQIPLNFKPFFKSYTNFHPSEEADALVFNMNSYPTTAWDSPDTDKRINSCYDPNRELVIFTDSESEKSGNSLVLHFINGEFTTWNSFDQDGYYTTAITAFDGSLYVGTVDPDGDSGIGLARTANEVTDPNTYTYDYISRSAPRLMTAWITVGEPSLEKLLLQLKMFGYIRTPLNIRHYANWDITTPMTDVIFTPDGNYVFFHKQRLNSSKQMAAAIEIELRPSGETFWIEGMEVEMDVIQQGMKR